MRKSSDSGFAEGVILNVYPDSLGENIKGLVELFSRAEFESAFSMLYLLPTLFHSDLDRGFSIIDYELNEEVVSRPDLQELKRKGLELKLDIVLNHLSTASPQFRDLLEFGDDSPFKDFFIDWNRFWEGNGKMGPYRVIVPDKEHLEKLFMRKPGLPVLKVPFPDGTRRPYWNTFYQEIQTVDPGEPEGKPVLLGQMDVDARSDAVWEFYDETMSKLKDYGARIIRLDAFAYLHKEVGAINFFNTPGTWDYLERLEKMAEPSKIYIGKKTYEHIKDIFKTKPVRKQTVKGKTMEVSVYEVLV